MSSKCVIFSLLSVSERIEDLKDEEDLLDLEEERSGGESGTAISIV